MNKIAVIICLSFASVTVSADCLYNGYLYPTGAVIGGLTCQADGTWG